VVSSSSPDRFPASKYDAVRGNFQLVFASEYVCASILYKWHRDNLEKLQSFLASARDATFAGLRGQLLEMVAHTLLQRGGTFTCRKLVGIGPKPAEQKVVFPASGGEVVSFNNVQELHDKRNHYARPNAANYGGIDSLIPPQNLFQMTVSPHHPVLIKSLEEIDEVFQPRGITPKPPTTYNLYFVVPEDVFPKFTSVQSYYGASKKVLKIENATPSQKDLMSRVTQYALELKIQDVVKIADK